MPQLIDFLSEPAQKLLVSQGPALVKQLGIEVVRSVVYDILLGKNVRSSTFQNNLTRGPKNYYMATIIIIDKMGKKSKLEAQAQGIGGNIVQMSMSLWPQQVARILHEKVGYENPLVTMPSGEVPEYLKHKLAAINLERIIAVLPEESESDEEIRIDEPGN